MLFVFFVCSISATPIALNNNNNNCWSFTSEYDDLIMRDTVLEGCVNFDHSAFSNVPAHGTVHGPQ